MGDSWSEQIAGIGALAEPARQALYRYVVAQPEAVGREEAARATGVALHSAKFHLDRLVEEGLLEVEFRRLTGRQGPGAGRPAKLYRRSHRELAVSLPERHYELAGEVMASAMDQALRDRTPLPEAIRTAARARGRGVGEPRRSRSRGGVSTRSRIAAELRRTADALEPLGYEPRIDQQEVCLANCPFDKLAAEHTELICGMNLDFIDGVMDGLGCRNVEPALAPHEGFCCVRVRAARDRDERGDGRA